ncbi:MAG: extracellular solute-binding protein [Planctomycetes bacterium]|nr:extracellular solute-binding protein [Planctomycetota bacterium]
MAEAVQDPDEGAPPGGGGPSAETVALPPQPPARRSPFEDSASVVVPLPAVPLPAVELDPVSVSAATVVTPPPGAPGGSGSRSRRAGLEPGERLGRFEVVAEIGRGGMGVVYRAIDQDLKREVALKVLSVELSDDARELERFRREATLASKLRHPRIIGVYSFGEVEGRPFYTMPLVEGRSLKEVLQQEGPLPPKRAAKLIEQVAVAIDAAHQQRVVHRDLKPANILLDPDGGPLILDFGLAKDLGRAPDLTRSGEVLGTPCYMSPEQARGEATHADHRVDVYALGAILFELLTGRPPYEGLTANEVLHKILTQDPPPPAGLRPDVPYELETICLKALVREPFFRYQTADALADDLRRFVEDRPVLARRPGPGAAVVRFVRAHRAATAMLGLLILTVVLGVLMVRRNFNRIAAIETSENALKVLAAARDSERHGHVEDATRGYHKAYVLAEEAYGDFPGNERVRNAFLSTLRARADFAEVRENWPLAEELRERLWRTSHDDEDERRLRHARGEAVVEVLGLREGESLDFYRWDRAIGAVDSSQRTQAHPDRPRVSLRAGSYVGVYRIPGRVEDDQPRYLVALGRGQEHALTIGDPGPPPPGMVFVPGATFVLGREGADADEAPRVVQAGPLWLDRTEVTIAAYREFLAYVDRRGHGACGPGCAGDDHRPPGFPERAGSPAAEDRPVTGVTWFDARAYANWRGKRLPTEAEWELAAGAVDQRTYPWGDRWEAGRANFQRDEICPVLDYPADVSPYGVVGLAGNADEWCEDEQRVPGTGDVARVLRGGVWYYQPEEGGRIFDRTFAYPGDRFRDTGFRCAADAPRAGMGVVPLGVPRPAERPPAPRVEGPPVVLRVAGWPHYADHPFAEAFARRHLEATGVAVVVTQTVTITSNDELLPLLRAGEVELVTPSCDYARTIIDSGLVQPLRLEGREAELLPPFRAPPFLQKAGRSYGAPFAYGPMWLVSTRERVSPGRWGDLWSDEVGGRAAVWDDAVWAVTLGALDLGLEPLFDLSDAQLEQVEAHLERLLRAGVRLWRTPEEAVALVEAGQAWLIDDWGIVERELHRRGHATRKAIPEGGSTVWIDSWMISRACEGPALEAAQAWVEYALSPENQRDLLVLAGYDPTNSRTARLLDKRAARLRVQTLRERLEGLQRWREVPRRERYLEVWSNAKRRAGR